MPRKSNDKIQWDTVALWVGGFAFSIMVWYGIYWLVFK